MKINDSEIKWLKSRFPNLQYDEKSQKIMGELDFCAAYDKESGKVIIGNIANRTETLIRDVFEVEICLGDLDMNGWPKVREVGKRHHEIAQKCNIAIIDLHINPQDNTCCLGIKFPDNRIFKIKPFIHKRLIPFFYRLSYVEKFGIDTSRNDLWEEYSHSDEGLREYFTEIVNFAGDNSGRNDLCPCGSGKKYKKCHINDVETYKRLTRSGDIYQK